MTQDHRVIIAGTGFGGLGMAMQLKREGIHDFVILEKAFDLGGTWRDNTYPGCACDVPSMMYSWSFAQNPNWSKFFSPSAEIWDYMRNVAVKHGIEDHILYGHEVLGAEWDDDDRLWHVQTNQGDYTSEVVISAVGALHEPFVPALKGLDRFEGTTFHSARWNHAHKLDDARVAVVGTGASAIQFVPEIQPKVESLTLFQRTAPWVMPRQNFDIPRPAQRAFKAFPALQRLARLGIYVTMETLGLGFRRPHGLRLGELIARRNMRRQIPDKALRRKLTPDYAMGCKRVLGASQYYPALSAPNADVVTDGIAEVRPDGIVDDGGAFHEVDTIIFGTGFHVTDQPIAHRIRTKDGSSLAARWQGSPRAHRGTTIPGAPNFFMLLGPGTGLGHNSIIHMLESQSHYIASALKYMDTHNIETVEPTAAAEQAWIDAVDRDMKGTVWVAGGCDSWYLDETGRNSTLWPGSTYRFRRELARFEPSEYIVQTPRPARRREVVAA